MAEKKNRVTGIRLTATEREALRKIGNGSLTMAIRDAIELLFKHHNVNLAQQN